MTAGAVEPAEIGPRRSYGGRMVAPPGATTHGPAAEALIEGAEYDAETEDAAEASEAAAAAAGKAAEDGPGANSNSN